MKSVWKKLQQNFCFEAGNGSAFADKWNRKYRKYRKQRKHRPKGKEFNAKPFVSPPPDNK